MTRNERLKNLVGFGDKCEQEELSFIDNDFYDENGHIYLPFDDNLPIFLVQSFSCRQDIADVLAENEDLQGSYKVAMEIIKNIHMVTMDKGLKPEQKVDVIKRCIEDLTTTEGE